MEYVRAAWALRDAREQARYEAMTEEEAESIALEARERAEYLAVEGPVLAVVGIPGYEHLLPEYLRDEPTGK